MLKKMTVAIALVLFASAGAASDISPDERAGTEKTTQTVKKPDSQRTITSTDEARAAAAGSRYVAQCDCPCRRAQLEQPRR